MSVLFRLGGDQGYISSSFEELIEGTHCNFADSQKTKRDFLETINKAEKVIENDGVRVILIGKDEKQINPNFKTLTYSKK